MKWNKTKINNISYSIIRCFLCFSALVLAPVTLVVASDIKSSNQKFIIKRNHSGAVNFITGYNNKPITIKVNKGQSLSSSIANQFLKKIGINGPDQKLQVVMQKNNFNNGQYIRYQQYYQGLPIIGAEIIANTNYLNQLTSITGKSLQIPLVGIQTNVKISTQEATAKAILATSTWHSVNAKTLSSTSPELSIFDISLLGPGDRPPALSWKIEVTSSSSKMINEFIVVDAINGEILVHFNQAHSALDRKTYTLIGATKIPGVLVCDESNPTCTGGSIDAIAAHKAAEDAYNFYKQNHNRDSIDNKGMSIIQTVEIGPGVNAFWAGSPDNQIFYRNGMSAGMDVVAHELTHGITEFESNLFYYYQSGAINESLSDVWGELIDQANAPGKALDLRWLIGDEIGSRGTNLLKDFAGNPVVAFRSMKDPTVYGDPDKMSSPKYHMDFTDEGGVHTNSGINNKAVFLMTDGGSFNGFNNIQPLGAAKVADIYYQAQTTYLTSSSTYIDLYNALIQSCSDLVNLNNSPAISTNDCIEMKKAIDAVEMNKSPVEDYILKAELCLTNEIPKNYFYDDMETANSNWILASLITNKQHAWIQNSPGYAISGTKSLTHTIKGVELIQNSVPDKFSHLGIIHDSATMKNAVSLPTQKDSYLHFNQSFGLPLSNDIAVLEYSLNGGAWVDAGGLITEGRTYTGTSTNTQFTYPSATNPQQLLPKNPLVGKNGFVNNSHGYNSTRLTLPSANFGGKSIKFRWSIGSDNYYRSNSLNIDDVRIYTCASNTAPSANAGEDLSKNTSESLSINGTGSDTETLQADLIYSWKQISGDNVIDLTGSDTATISFTTPASATTLTFELTVKDKNGGTATDTVDIVVTVKSTEPAPSSGATKDDSGGCILNKNATFDPLMYLLLVLFTTLYLRNKFLDR
jgi:Zn-dependent metalloprotease